MAITSLSFGSAPADRVSAPPDYPDAAHVINGCYISTVVYIDRFLREHPQEKAWPLPVEIHNVDGVARPHTMALLTWRGQWWGRDEYFGVFAVDSAAGDGVVTDQVVRRAERALDRHSDERAKDLSLPLPKPPPLRLATWQRAHEIAVARELLPFAAERYWVRCGGEEIPLLLFRPAPGQIAVYDPLSGTAQAEIDWSDGARIVSAVATRLGYRVASIRTDAGASATSG